MKIINKIRKYICILIAATGMMLSLPVAAQGVDAGSGGGPSVPLYLRECSISDGEKNVATDVTITLYYSHNVADAAVQDHNRSAISVKDSNGKKIDITVGFSDVFEYRQEIYVQLSNLSSGTTYTITISPDLMARNGYTTGSTDTITFTTKEDNTSASTDESENKVTEKEENTNKTVEKEEKKDNSSVADNSAEKEDASESTTASAKNESISDEESKSTENAADSIEESKRKEALEKGIIEETSEKEIQKVSDKKPGKIETSSKGTVQNIEKTETADNSLKALAGCLIGAAALIAVQILHSGIKKNGK